jgi:hypothetical protein
VRSLSLDDRQATEAELREALVEVGRREARSWRRSRRDYLKDARFGAESELAYRVLAARTEENAPTTEQRRFLSLLREGKRQSDDLGRIVDFRDPNFVAGLRDAEARGWLQVSLGGIGGLVARPPSWFEITPLGSRILLMGARERPRRSPGPVLRIGPFGARPAAGVRATVAGVAERSRITPEMREAGSRPTR